MNSEFIRTNLVSSNEEINKLLEERLKNVEVSAPQIVPINVIPVNQ